MATTDSNIAEAARCDDMVKDLELFWVTPEAPYEIIDEDEWSIIDSTQVMNRIDEVGLRGYDPEVAVAFWAGCSARKRCEYEDLMSLLGDLADEVGADLGDVKEYGREVPPDE